MKKIDVNKIMQEVICSDDDDKRRYWFESKYEQVPSLTPVQKGSFGSCCVRDVLQSDDCVVEKISDQGDLLIKYLRALQENKKSEVKLATNTAFPDKKGETRVTLWWNQIRPNQEGWSLLHLVAVFPNKVVIWEIPREDFEELLNSESEIFNGLSHKGTDELVAIKLTKNSQTDTVKLLDKYIIYDEDKTCNLSLIKEPQEKNNTTRTAA